VRDFQLDVASGQVGIFRRRIARQHLAGESDDGFNPQPFQPGKIGIRRRYDALRKAVMVAKIDEQQAPMVALAVDPAGKPDGLANIARAQLAAIMRPVGVHGGELLLKYRTCPGMALIDRADKRMSPSSLSISASGLDPTLSLETDSVNKEESAELRLISDTAELEQACETLAAGDFLAVDTEFHRETTYWPQVCLIQVANADFDVLVDPMATGIDLSLLMNLLADKSKVKVFHAARQDLEIFTRVMGEPPSPLFDTQIAAMACGLGDSISYENLVSRVLKVQVDKSSQFTDWARRPLSEKQMTYARGDVLHLRKIYRILHDKLVKQNRLDWIADEHAALLDPELYAFDPASAWKRLKIRKYRSDYLAVLA